MHKAEKLIILLNFLLFFFSCANNNNHILFSLFKTITYTTGSCFGRCDGWPIEINFTDTLGVNKKVIGEPDNMPDSIYTFVVWLQGLSRAIHLEKITDTTFFEKTNIDKRNITLMLLPPPPIKSVNFKPPKNK